MRKRERGSVLIMVIWAMSLLAAYAVIIARQVSGELGYAQWTKNRVQLRTLASAGVERAVMEIQADTQINTDAYNKSWASNQDAFKEVSFGSGDFSVRCPEVTNLMQENETLYGACDEAARININTAPETVLYGLIKTADPALDENQILVVVRSIIDWRDPDDGTQVQGAESTYYKDLSDPYFPRNAHFESVEELRMVRGMTPEIFDKIKNSVTVYTDGKINVNTASSLVFQAFGLDAALTQKILEYRAGVDLIQGNQDDRVFSLVDNIASDISGVFPFSVDENAKISQMLALGLATTQTSVFRIHSIGRLITQENSLTQKVICVVNRQGSILFWHEGEL